MYETAFKKRFRWIRAELFTGKLATALRQDARALLDILTAAGEWKPEHDPKLNALHTLLTHTHPNEKVLVFTQFADTVEYLVRELRRRGVTHIEGAIGSSKDPTELAWRFSPGSNNKTYTPDQELRVLIATDVLSEGQNLQDAHVIVNFDLPWAIIRLIQRAGRVDRIGQQAREIDVYSFLPADGVERLINLRARVRQRLAENAEVVGTDERFFEDDEAQKLVDLYNEKAGLLDGETDTEVDLASYAYQIWQNALKEDPTRNARIPALPDVVYSTKAHHVTANGPAGVLVYTRTPSGYDALAWMDEGAERYAEPAEGPPGRRVPAGHRRPAAPGGPPRSRPAGRGAHRRAGGRTERRAAGPPQRRPRPHLRTPEALLGKPGRQPVRQPGSRPGHRRHLPAPAARRRRRHPVPATAQRHRQRNSGSAGPEFAR
ncbi:helicase-related protein [Deinococcus caeni]|uniref:C-terminal helicase domain-containing protein n=1 Tax=Deinococcus caeni TaxID=569127 RepID=UPI00361D82C8